MSGYPPREISRERGNKQSKCLSTDTTFQVEPSRELVDGEGQCVAAGDVLVWQIKGLRLFPETKLPGEGGGLVVSTEHQP